MKVCKTCKSENVFYDAYVGVNDSQDTRVFDTVLCDDCGGETSLLDVEPEKPQPHDGHVLKYVMLNTNVEQNAVITSEGNVEVSGPLVLLDFGQDNKVYCDTCEKFISASEDGLGEFWEVR
jgi:hypothetical protein